MGTEQESQQYEMLPPRFVNQRRLRHVLYGWLATTITSATVFGGIAVAATLRSHQEQQERQQVVTASLPLFQLRREIAVMNQDNAKRRNWCAWVETTKPSDDLFQTMAAVVDASTSVVQASESEQIKIDKLQVKLPLEYPHDSETIPAWALPSLSVTARTGSTIAAKEWVEAMNASDRIDSAEMDAPALDRENAQVIINATPVATQVLP